MHYLPLLGILIVVLGFALRLNPLLVVTVAAIATGLIAGKPLLVVIAAFGKAFNDNRFVTIIYILLPVIGILERYGLQQRARTLIGGMKRATVGRLLIAYLLFRQITASLGLTSVAGQAQTVRPLVAPMAEAAAEVQQSALDEAGRERVKAFAAATDNVGLFFGEDIFIAIGSILLMVGFLKQSGIVLAPLDLSVYAIPSAICAFLIHAARLLWLDRSLASLSARMGRGVEADRQSGGLPRAGTGCAAAVGEGGGGVEGPGASATPLHHPSGGPPPHASHGEAEK